MVSRRNRIEASLQALGAGGFPETVELADGRYRLARILQHSFFAATAQYVGPSGKIVVKWGRSTSFLLIPLSWLGRWLTSRELRMYRAVEDLDGVPACLGPVGDNGFAHAYAEGRPHRRGEPLAPEFFHKLQDLIDRIHRRGMAYADLSKPENILIGDDGNPHLIDFQIAMLWHSDRKLRRGFQRVMPEWLGRRLLHDLQEGDQVHVLKHWRRSAGDSLTPEQYERSIRRTDLIRFHFLLTSPYRWIRRSIRLLWRRGGSPPANSTDNAGR